MSSEHSSAQHNSFAKVLLELVRDVWNPLEVKMVLAVAALGGISMPVAEREIVTDVDVLAGVRADGSSRSPADRVAESLDAAVTRGVLLALGSDDTRQWFVLATEANRRKAQSGGFVVPDSAPPAALSIERPGIFALYEQNIGLLTPLDRRPTRRRTPSLSRDLD